MFSYKTKKFNSTKILYAGAFVANISNKLYRYARPRVFKTNTKSNIINLNATAVVLRNTLKITARIKSRKGGILIHSNTPDKNKKFDKNIKTSWHPGFITNYKKNKHQTESLKQIVTLTIKSTESVFT